MATRQEQFIQDATSGSYGENRIIGNYSDILNQYGGHEVVTKNFGGALGLANYLKGGGGFTNTTQPAGYSGQSSTTYMTPTGNVQKARGTDAQYGNPLFMQAQEQATGGTKPTELGSPTAMTPDQPQVNTGQPSPTTVQVNPFTGGPATGGTTMAGTTDGVSPSTFEQNFSQANAMLYDANYDPATGSYVVQQYSPTGGGSLSTLQVQSDPFMNNLVGAWQAYISPENQRASLADTYNQMIKDTGIEAMDMELIDLKNVIEGSEDDIRNEITKAGGFATDSQVLALTNARNKQLIKNYNTLVEQRNAKEKYLQTAIQLEAQDREAADRRFESMFNMGMQLATYQQQMRQYAVQQMQWTVDKIGFDGLYNSINGDPYYASMIEQTLGLPQGGLKEGAQQAEMAKIKAEQERQLEMQAMQTGIEADRARIGLVNEQIKTEQLTREKIRREMESTPERKYETIKGDDGKWYRYDEQANEVVEIPIPAGTDVADEERIADLQTKYSLIQSLKDHAGLDSRVGPLSIARKTFAVFDKFGTGQDFAGKVHQLANKEFIDYLVSVKSQGATFGALNQSEADSLRQAATAINDWEVKNDNGIGIGEWNISEKKFKDELDKLLDLAGKAIERAGGTPALPVEDEESLNKIFQSNKAFTPEIYF